jgi:hypothetical protein
MSAAQKGRVFSPETIEKMRVAQRGHAPNRLGAHHTEEAKEKIRVARENQVHPSLAARGITIEILW